MLKTLFFEDWDFFSNLGKNAPKFLWEWGRISAPENTEKIPVACQIKCRDYYNAVAIWHPSFLTQPPSKFCLLSVSMLV